MSITPEAIWAPAPTTTRGRPTILDCDSTGSQLVYASGKSIFVRSIDSPATCHQYTGHTSSTTAARFAPSGFYIASGDTSGTVRIWDAKASSVGGTSGTSTSTTKAEYPVTAGRINDLAWDGESQRLIAVGDGRGALGKCFTADSGNSVGEIGGHAAAINCVSIRQQRPLRAVTGSDDTSLVFYHGAPFKYQAGLQGRHTRYVYGCAFSPDGERMVSVGADGRVWVYDGKTGEAKGEIGKEEGAHVGSVFAVSWAKDSRRVVTAGADHTVKVWDVGTGKVLRSWRLQSEGCGPGEVLDQQMGVVWVRGRKEDLVIACNLAGDLTYLSPASEKPIRVIQGHQRAITAFGYVEKPRALLWTGCYGGKVISWNLDGLASCITGDGHGNQVVGFSNDPRDALIHSLGWDDTLRSISCESLSAIGEIVKLGHQPIAVCTTAESLYVITAKPSVDVYQLSKPKLLVSHELPTAATTIASTRLSTGAEHTAIGFSDHITRIYTNLTQKLQEVTSLTNSTAPISALSFSPAPPHLLAVGDSCGKINVYDPTEAYKLVTNRWSSHTARVTGVAWNAAGTHAVSCGLDTNISLWSLKAPGKRVRVAGAHKEGVSGVVWVDERRVASMGADGAVRVWQVGELD